MTRRSRLVRPATLAVLVAATLVSSVVAAAPAAAADPVIRLYEADRVATATMVATAAWHEAPEVVLSTSVDYPDAVAGAALAARQDAPVLLTPPDHLAPQVREALADLGTDKVTIVGGPLAVSSEVDRALRDAGHEVERVYGHSRYGTAAELAEAAAGDGPVSAVALAVGELAGRDAWPDALSAASLAGLEEPVPTLLTRPDHLPGDTRETLQRLQPDTVLVLGGDGVIAEPVVEEIRALGLGVQRVAGADRYATSVEVAQVARRGVAGTEGLASQHAVFVSGEDFPDALAAGALAARHSAPLVLVPEERLADGTDGYLRADETPVEGSTLVGGPAAVTAFVEQELEAAITGAPRPQPPPPPCPPNSSPDCAYTYEHPISTWEELARCESGGNWALSSGNGYHGGLQFSLSSWRGVGGSDYPHWHSKWEQIHRGELLQQRQGWGAWPSCARRMGLR